MQGESASMVESYCDPATWVLWPKDSVSIDDQPIQDSVKRFFLFHKPKGVITTHSDEKGRKTIFDVLPADLGYMHAVGRLDQATSGLLLLTNDSALSSFLTDPAHKVMRTYLVSVRGEFTEAQATEARVGVVDGGERLQCHTREDPEEFRTRITSGSGPDPGEKP